ncbi:MAG: proline--tRNA ligase, partial [Chryseobacterium sp.]|nr:proline--tRNA ligase [Chryseobacterium sp.]
GKAFDVKFTTKEGKIEYTWGTSWGTSTRLIGALIMTHSDDLGLVLPPTLAPIQVVIVPIFKGEEQLAEISKAALDIQAKLRARGISVRFDDDTQNKPGWKFAEYELKGVPLRIAMGPRDLENKTVELARRDNLTKESVSVEGLDTYIEELLKTIQNDIYTKALTFREENMTKVDSYDEFKKVLEEKGGFILAHWDGTEEEEEQIKQETKATIRCIPLNNEQEDGISLITGKPSKQRVVFAKAY